MKVSVPKAILFDLDDTLLAFSAGRPDFWVSALATCAPHLHRAGAAAFAAAIQRVAGEFWAPPQRAAAGRLDLFWARRQVAQGAFAQLGWGPLPLAHAVADEFTRSKEEAVSPFPGAIDLLERLTAQGVALGLVTNGHPSFQNRKIERFGLARFFKVVRIEGEFGVGKPHPSIFRSALSRLGTDAGSTWMVGDNLDADIAGAQSVGIHAVWHDHAGRGLPNGVRAVPDRIICRIAELM